MQFVQIELNCSKINLVYRILIKYGESFLLILLGFSSTNKVRAFALLQMKTFLEQISKLLISSCAC